MMNELENEPVTSNLANFDARIVHTVRNLKKIPSRKSNESNFQNEETSNPLFKRINSNSPKETVARSLNEIAILKSQNELKKMRISIDGSGQSTSDSNKLEKEIQYKESNSLNKKIGKNQITLKKASITGSKPIKFSNNNVIPSMMKTKSEFQKRLMNENSINKYKTMCMTIFKDDEEIRKLSESANLISNMATSTGFTSKENFNLEKLLEDNFFSDKYFMYKLECLLESDVSKAKKEKFFKDEIKSFLGLQILDLQYQNKLSSLDIALDNHLKNIENFNFFN
jgi:hypothetical protein